MLGISNAYDTEALVLLAILAGWSALLFVTTVVAFSYIVSANRQVPFEVGGDEGKREEGFE